MQIADITAAREKLTANYNRYLTALDAVAELISSDEEREMQPEAPLIAPRQKPVKAPRVAAPKVKPPKTNGEKKHNSEEVAAVAAKLPQPFTPAGLCTAAGLTNSKNASNYIQRWQRNGWVKAVGYGQWERTAKFPGADPKRVVIPGDPVAQTDEEKLADAKAEWLKAHKAGQTTLATILADKVQHLEDRIREK